LNLLEKLFSKSDLPSDNKSDINHTLQLATCILLIEVSKSDDDFDIHEQEKIKKLIQNKFNLTIEELNHIFSVSSDSHTNMTSLFEWTDIINNECSYEEKLVIIGFMWDIAFTDSKIDKYEDYTIRKVSELIYVKHKDFIALKNDRIT
tara:strand:+ start:259 stop:702 length:444 start_codon:yes stop_codon:yes gene_type:complete